MAEQDDLERLGERIRAYVVAGVESVDSESAAQEVLARPRFRTTRGTLTGQGTAISVLLVLGAVVLLRSPGTTGLQPTSPATSDRSTNVLAAPGTAPALSPSMTNAPEASKVLSERERSDYFWNAVADFHPTKYHYDSLKEMTADAHLIVRGRVIGIESGAYEPFDSDPEFGTVRRVTLGIVAVDEVLKGEVATQSPGTILVARLGRNGFTESDLPGEDVILFLMNYSQVRAEEGYPPSSDPLDAYLYVRPNGSQCVLRNIDGTVEIVEGFLGHGLDAFPADLDGSPFAKLLERIRDLAQSV